MCDIGFVWLSYAVSCGTCLQNNEDLIQDALRITAYSMEAQNWPLVEWFLKEHASPDLGAYFMPVIAQVGAILW